jgi:hypothetical protein
LLGDPNLLMDSVGAARFLLPWGTTRCLGVTVPDIRLIDSVKDEVCQGDGISLVIF